MRRFDIEITPHSRCWRNRIPEVDGLIRAGSRDQAEMMARGHIAVSIGARIAEVAVRVVPCVTDSTNRSRVAACAPAKPKLDGCVAPITNNLPR